MEWIFGIGIVLLIIYILGQNGKKPSVSSDNKLWDDSEFDEKNFHFINFKNMQELAVKFGSDKIVFKDKQSELKYFHFFMGAIDGLSRLIADEKGSEVWFMLAPAMIQDGDMYNPELLETYGRSGNPEFDEAGKLGYQAMYTYLKMVAKTITFEEGNHFELALSKLLRSS